MKTIVTDIAIIGAGSGGLTVAAVASQMGAKVVLCEAHKMGGDCLNTGCVPSKALIEASRHIKIAEKAKQLGILIEKAAPNFDLIHAHIQDTIKTIEPHDSISRFESLGVKVITHAASFKNKTTLIAGPHEIKAKYIVIATGSVPAIPPIQGLSEIAYLTNETLFDLKEKPKRLTIVGGGPIGCEIANAYALLGVKVDLLESSPQILGTIDSEARSLIRKSLIENGVNIQEEINIISLSKEVESYKIETNMGEFSSSHLLIATGRTPNIKQLELDKADIDYHSKGISVDARMRTSQKRIFAIGDVASRYQFTHAAAYQAGILIRNMLFKLPAKVNYNAFPKVIYTTPEIAEIGNLDNKNKNITLLKYELKDNDRAIAGKDREGFIKIAVGKKGRIVGASIVATHAGELLTPWIIAINSKLSIKDMASFIAPYPTLSEASKRVAGSYYAPALYGARTKKIVRFLMRIF